MRTLVSFRGQTGDVRTETFMGREHIVIPIIALVEGVMQAENAPGPELVQEEIFARTAEAWNGRPTVVNHPRRNGELVSANSPEVLESEQLGTVFNAKVENGKLTLEAWIDKDLSDAAGGKKKDVIDRAAEGKTVEISIGAFVDVEKADGKFNGRTFEGRWINIVPDHLAILEDGKTGACSVKDGCGTNRSAEGVGCGPGCACNQAGGDAVKLHERILDTLRSAPGEISRAVLTALFGRVTGGELSDTDTRNMIESALSNENADEWIFVVAVFDDRVVYAQGAKLLQRDYSINNERDVTFGESIVEVTPRTEFIAVTKHGDEDEEDDNDDENNNEEEEERDMKLAERVKGLIENPKTRFEESDEKWLSALEEDAIDKLEPEKEATPPPDPDAAVDDPNPEVVKTADEYLEAAPAEVRSVLSEGLRLQRERKAHFIKALTENPRNGFSEDDLGAMDTQMLERMAKLADLPDYSAQGAVTSLSSPADDPSKAPPMPQVFDLTAARKAS